MNYSVITTKDIHNNQELTFVKNGSKYYVCLADEKELVKKDFEDFNKAIEMYNYISTIFIKGWYSFEDRKDILNGIEPLLF